MILNYSLSRYSDILHMIIEFALQIFCFEGTIVRKYRAGDWVPITVDITTNHGGFFIFKLCHNDNINQDPDQHCFDQNILETGEHGEQEFKVTDDMWGPVKMFVKLPDHVSCHQCILQVHQFLLVQLNCHNPSQVQVKRT